MNRFSLSNLAAATMVVSVGLMVGAILTVSPTPSQAAKGGKGGGGGNQTTPATITFLDAGGHELLSDGVYDNTVGGLEVFIGSAANEGNIRIKGLNAVPIRTLNVTVPVGDACGLSTGPPTLENVELESLKVDAASVLSGGIFSIAQGESVAIPMGIRFARGEDLFFLQFDPQVNGPCKIKSGFVQVERTGAASWTVSDAGPACVEKHKSKGKNDLCFGMAEMNFSFDLVEK